MTEADRLGEQQGGTADIPPDTVRAQLARILGDARFESARQRRDLLRYVVEETLAGRGDRLKGYAIATRVFGRPDDFDPQADPVVRIEARRLRRDLDAYYMGPGRDDPVLIAIPKGRYLPVFAWRERAAPPEMAPRDSAAGASAGAPAAAPSPPSAARRAAPRPLMAAAALGAGALMLGAFDPGGLLGHGGSALRRPAIAIAPLQPASDTETARFLADGVPHELVSNLMRFPDFRLFWLAASPAADGPPDLAALARQEIGYLLAGSIAAQAEGLRLSAQLVDTESGQVIWSETYERALTPLNLLTLRADLAGEIATALGQPYGVVRNDILAREIAHVPSELESYHCVLLAHRYRRDFLDGPRAEAQACLEAAVARDPRYPEAWAMLGWLHLDQGRFAAGSPEEAARAYERGFSAATRALALDPDNVQALKALSSINHYRGAYAEGERLAREALALNPHDPDTLAHLGWRLAIRGDFAEGTRLLRRAIERSIEPPGWYHDLIAIDHMMRGEHAEMLATARRSGRDRSAMNHAFVAIAEAHLGNAGAARAALARMAELWPRLAVDPAGVLRTHGAIEEIVAEMLRGLRLAGWRPPEERDG